MVEDERKCREGIRGVYHAGFPIMKEGRINHGTWNHPAPQDFNCEACRRGIGHLEIKLEPMYEIEHKDQMTITAFGFIGPQRKDNREP